MKLLDWISSFFCKEGTYEHSKRFSSEPTCESGPFKVKNLTTCNADIEERLVDECIKEITTMCPHRVSPEHYWRMMVFGLPAYIILNSDDTQDLHYLPTSTYVRRMVNHHALVELSFESINKMTTAIQMARL